MQISKERNNINNLLSEIEKSSPFIVRSSLYVTLLMVVFLLPFGINNFLQGRGTLGFGVTAIIILCAINAWNCSQNRFQPLVILFGIVPFIIVFLVMSFRQQGMVGILWSYPAVLSFYFMLPSRYAWLANALLLVFLIPESWQLLDTPMAIRYAVTLTTSSALAGIFIWFITKQQYKLQMMAVIDPLTGLYNRRCLDAELVQAVKLHQKQQIPMTLLMFDLDHFKSINDTLGHYAGDSVLKGIGQYFAAHVRKEDMVFRIGGEEFIVLMKNVAADSAFTIADSMRQEIENLPLLSDRKVTASIGVSELTLIDSATSWMQRGDKGLYQAKANGRNQVIIG